MDAKTELAQTIARLHTVSHVNATDFEGRQQGHDTSESMGGKRPPGGIDHQGDREPDFAQKSAEHFHRRAGRCRTTRDYQLVLNDAQRALNAWQRAPTPTNPTLDHPRWKHWVAQSLLPDAEIARLYMVSRQYVNRVRRQYRTAA